MPNDENLYIDGAFVPSSGSARIGLINPATEERFAQVADATEADVDAAVVAARRALPAWRETTAAERAAVLVKIADGIAGRAGEMGALVMKETGATPQWAGYLARDGHFLYRGAAAMIARPADTDARIQLARPMAVGDRPRTSAPRSFSAVARVARPNGVKRSTSHSAPMTPRVRAANT